jgi:tripartite-type tricarboxylate transporter receptor subunit TctC
MDPPGRGSGSASIVVRKRDIQLRPQRLLDQHMLAVLLACIPDEPKIDVLTYCLNQAMQTPDARASLRKLSVETQAVTPQEFKTFMAAETQKWAQVVADAHIKGE